MNKNTFTASLIILLSLTVMVTAVLCYYYIMSIRRLGQVHSELIAIQQTQNRVTVLSRIALGYQRTNPAIEPILQEFNIGIRTVGDPIVGTNSVSEVE